MKVLTGVCLFVATALALSACAGSHHAVNGTPVSAKTITSSRLILGGRVRCTATLTTPVEAGQAISVGLSLHNISGSAVRAPVVEGSAGLVVKAADGTTYNTTTAAEGSLGGPYRAPVTIAPGATTTRLGSPRVAVRWKGPLRVVPQCERTALPALRVGVTASGPPPDERTAIADVVAATGHLLDHCRPGKSGAAVEGQIDPPSGSEPPMDARCSVTLHSEGRFQVAQVLVVIPRDWRGVHIEQQYETLSFEKRPPPYEAIAWELVVTENGAVTVAGFMHDGTRAAHRMAPGWTWTGTGWSAPGSSRCGFEGFSGGPSIDWISACP